MNNECSICKAKLTKMNGIIKATQRQCTMHLKIASQKLVLSA